jgi:uncharacterized membrane protein YjjB (DUF3815 family)
MEPATHQMTMTMTEVLRLKPVRRLWIAQIVSVFGDFLAIFAVLSYVSFNLNASAAQVTGITVYHVPFALSDLWQAYSWISGIKRTMIASDLIRAALAVGLVFGATLTQVRDSVLSRVVRHSSSRANVTLRISCRAKALRQTDLSTGVPDYGIFSPALAGVVRWFGASSCYYVDSLSYLVSASSWRLVIAREPVHDRNSHPISRSWTT